MVPESLAETFARSNTDIGYIHPVEYITKLRNASKKCKQNFLDLDFKASKISKFTALLVFWPVLNVALKVAYRQSASFGVP